MLRICVCAEMSWFPDTTPFFFNFPVTTHHRWHVFLQFCSLTITMTGHLFSLRAPIKTWYLLFRTFAAAYCGHSPCDLFKMCSSSPPNRQGQHCNQNPQHGRMRNKMQCSENYRLKEHFCVQNLNYPWLVSWTACPRRSFFCSIRNGADNMLVHMGQLVQLAL